MVTKVVSSLGSTSQCSNRPTVLNWSGDQVVIRWWSGGDQVVVRWWSGGGLVGASLFTFGLEDIRRSADMRVRAPS